MTSSTIDKKLEIYKNLEIELEIDKNLEIELEIYKNLENFEFYFEIFVNFEFYFEFFVISSFLSMVDEVTISWREIWKMVLNSCLRIVFPSKPNYLRQPNNTVQPGSDFVSVVAMKAMESLLPIVYLGQYFCKNVCNYVNSHY